jgi:hypothetical protein
LTKDHERNVVVKAAPPSAVASPAAMEFVCWVTECAVSGPVGAATNRLIATSLSGATSARPGR